MRDGILLMLNVILLNDDVYRVRLGISKFVNS